MNLLAVKEFLAQTMADFIWLRPWWLIVIPLSLLWLWYLSKREQSAGWQGHLSNESLLHLRSSHNPQKYYRYFALPLIVAGIALAGPTLTSMPTEAASSETATVLILDLSPSMLARDIKPDRLTQAKYKAIDILRQHREGEIGLIVYAADAYRVTPLTDDPATIKALIPTLHMDIMPAPGSKAEAAVALAVKMLHESSSISGTIILITDGITDAGLAAIKSNPTGEFRLSILGVGTEQGAAIPLESGVVTGENGLPVIAKLNGEALARLARRYDGRYANWTTDSADTDRLLTQKPPSARLSRAAANSTRDSGPVNKEPNSRVPKQALHKDETNSELQQYDRYEDLGYWLILPLLICAMFAFRKNVLITVFPLLLLSPEARSVELTDIWQSLWLNKNQQAREQLRQHNYEDAYHLFTQSDWKAIAAYHRGQYHEAALLLATPVYAEDLYNRGNAQALSGDLQAAMKSYSQALLLYGSNESTGYADTVHNINVLKRLIDDDQESGENDSSDSESRNESRSESNSEDNGQATTTDDADSNAQPQESEQSRIGGSTGPGQSLNQQSLEANEGVNSGPLTNASQATALPSDASARLNTPPQNGPLQSEDNTGPATAPQIAEDSNLVLSPYSEQWLRDLPQDPGGYLRRKFLYQYQISEARNTEQAVDSNSVRY